MSETAPNIGAVTRARTSVDAIRTLAALRKQGRTVLTPAEQEKLRGWSGWGPLALLFAPPNQTWLDLAEEVKSLITPAEFKMGNLATYPAFYTPTHIARLMWALLGRLGFAGGTVFEPGCGGGVFFDTAPDGATMVGVERDPVSASIVQLLHPGHKVITSPLEKAALPGGYTAVIGNVPFGDVPVFDPVAPRHAAASLHNYCIWRAVQELAPGGIAVLLTSRYTMDNTSPNARHEIGYHADLIGAVRLPNGGLGGGTEALADLVVLRRKTGDPEQTAGVPWMKARSFADGVSVNTYWDDNPGAVLGTMKPGQTNQYGLGVVVDGDLPALPARLDEACDTLARRAVNWGLTCADPIDPTHFDVGAEYSGDSPWWDGEYRFIDGVLHQMIPAKRETKTREAQPRHVAPVLKPSDELLRLLELRELARQLVTLEADHDLPDGKLAPLRAEALRKYRGYVAAYGAINRSEVVEDKPADLPVPPAKPDPGLAALAVLPTEDFGLTDYTDEPEIEYKLVTPRLGGFRKDPDFQLVAALEVYDDDTREHSPAPILTERQNRRTVRPTRTDDPAQALAWSLDHKGGRVDVGYIADALGVSRLEVPGLLGDRVFRDPSTLAWTTGEEYLSGNVRVKLRQAEAAVAAGDPQYERNVAALRKVLPRWLDAHKIYAQLGAVWVPEADIRRFVVELLEDGNEHSTLKVSRLEAGNVWELKHGGSRSSNAARIQWGTPHRDAYALIQDGLNGRVPVVVRPKKLPNGKIIMVKDQEKSLVAIGKLQEIQQQFADWLWKDPKRRKRLVTYYNETYNALVARQFDGSHLTIAGLAPWFAKKAYKHQFDYVARGIASGAALCGHPVGAGKTATMAMTIMKLIELGLIETGMITVPKHILEQTARQVRQLFPAARVLAVSSESISANRREFAARVVTQDWDIVIITHPAFDKIRVSDGTEAEYIAEQKQQLDESIRKASPRGELEPGMVKAAAKRSDRLTTQIAVLRARAVARDPGTITWEQLGKRIGYLCVDESQNYKNLAIPCRTDGFSIRASKRATDLDMKLAWLKQRRPGLPYASLFSGTPVSNTMLELYVVLHYTMPDYLQSIGLGTADAWAATFVQMVTSVDVSVDGGQFALKTRPGLFLNAPELRLLLSQCADIRTAEQLGLARPDVDERLIVVEPTALQQEYSLELVARSEEVKSTPRRARMEGEPPQDNMLKICTDGRRMATDPVLVGIDDPEPGKLAAVAQEVLDLWREHPEELQIVFCDLGTPNPKRGDQTYGRLRDLLVEGGMPAGRIEFIHSYNTGQAKAGLFSRCRTGQVSVVMGSTDKLGTGTNIQDRVVSMHHVDAPFRPADIEQRDGRGRRPGNRHATVKIFRYATKRTFDAYMWQLLARKIAFITQVLSGELDRTVEDIVSDKVLGFAAIKASVTDQPLLVEKAELDAEIKRLQSDERAWRMGHAELLDQIADSSKRIERYEATISRWQAIADAYTGKLTDEDRTHLEKLAADRFATMPITVAGVKVTRGTWTDMKDEEQPELNVTAGKHTAYEHRRLPTGYKPAQRLMRFHKPATWVKAFLEIADSAAGEAERHRGLLAEHHISIAKTRTMAEVPFAHQADLDAKLARLAVVEQELRDAAAPPVEWAATEQDIEAAAEADAIRDAAARGGEIGDDADLDAFAAKLTANVTALVDDPDIRNLVDDLARDALAAIAAL